MSRIYYTTSCLKDIVKHLQASSENKNQSEFTKMSIALRNENDHTLLHCETVQPSYSLCVVRNMLPDSARDAGQTLDAQTDNELCLMVLTDDLVRALGSVGQKEVMMHLEGSSVVLTNEKSQLTLPASPCKMGELPETLTDCIVLGDPVGLLEALRAAVAVAGVRGNELRMCGIHLHITSEGMVVEGANAGALAIYTATIDRSSVIDEPLDVVLTVECARRLVALLTDADCQQVRIKRMEAKQWALQSGPYTLYISEQCIEYPDMCEENDRTYTQEYELDRIPMLAALRSMRSMGEKEADLLLEYDKLTLSGVDALHGEAQQVLEMRTKNVGTCHMEAAGHYAIAPLITALANSSKHTEVKLQRDKDGEQLALDNGNLRMVVRQVR